MLQPIETIYRGHRFRSRLEARWAVFLHEMGIRYDYEPEGFVLGGIPYLPDFWVPQLSAWIEIKPGDAAVPLRARILCERLCEASRQTVLMVCGSPWPGEYLLDSWAGEDSCLPGDCHATPILPGRYVVFSDCRRCNALAYVDEEGSWGSWCEAGCDSESTPIAYGMPPDLTDWLPSGHSRIGHAYRAARSERFERRRLL